MASPSSDMSPWPGVKEPISFPAPLPVVHPTENITDSELILTRLREQIATGTQDPEALLGAIAIAAQAITDATGAALGMRRDGTVVCVGRSGETAPALGARLSESSGISGECLRSGRSQRCDDTENDSRVDEEVCRHLGLRSIAAVPVCSRLETVGILEVFSTSPQAFTEEHVGQLSSLAELADVANSSGNKNAVEPDNSIGTDPIPRPDLPILQSPWAYTETRGKPLWWYLAGAGGVLVLGLFLFASWAMWGELKSRNATQPTAAQPPATTTAATPPVIPLSANALSKPTPEVIASAQSTNNSSKKSRGVVPAADFESEPDDGLIRNIPADSPVGAKTENTASQPSKAEPLVEAPPQVAMVTSTADPLPGIPTAATSLPQLAVRQSEGVTPVVLERKVMPPYPHEAMAMRLEGPVVMRATITEKGQISQVKLVSGDPVLGRAAMNAVRQWHYRPALLNGKATQSETDITLNFKLP